MSNHHFTAAIFDLDGVITKTAQLHAQAWKDAFDAFLKRRASREGAPFEPFDIASDYKRFVDGKPRYDGVRSFLAARSIGLPEGAPEDEADKETVHGLGNKKNERFHELLEKKGVATYDDAVELLTRWRRQGLQTAMVTSSRNGAAILAAAELGDQFDATIDGVDAERMNLEGKPAPDIFLEAARQLDVEPREAIVLEDAIAGVEAGRDGEFGLVVGVARDEGESENALREHGANLVFSDLRKVRLDQIAERDPNAT